MGDVEIGRDLVFIAGPCSVEEEDTTLRIAEQVKKAGAQLFRGGAYKPRTSPWSFQGLREKGLKILAKVRRETGLPVVTEVIDSEDIDLVGQYTDVYQVGMRNMRNYALLAKLGKTNKPVLLKRGDSAKLEEWLAAADYVVRNGNDVGHPLRAGHPHVRGLHALHAGPQRGRRGQDGKLPARAGRPQPRHRAERTWCRR